MHVNRGASPCGQDYGLSPAVAALFAAVVRSPVTGIILVTEMTGSVTLLLPMLFACAMAMVVPTMLGNAPIYDSLSERLLLGSIKRV